MVAILICWALWLAAADAPPVDDALAQQVSQLVAQLDARQRAERDAAQRELEALGPGVLPLLPAVDERMPAEVAARVTRVRQQLLRAQAVAATQPSLVTLRGDDLPLAGVLSQLTVQTGNRITDYRAAFGQRAKARRVKAVFDKTTFWKALDDVLDQGDLTLYGFAGERGAFVVNRPPGAAQRGVHACYAGAFRLEPLRFEAQRDLRNEKLGGLKFFMEVSWEPRLQPFAILQPPADTSALGSSGRPIAPASRQAQGETLIREGFSTTELEIPFELPGADDEKIDLLKGKLVALVPGPLAEFRFEKLPIAGPNARPTPVEARQGNTLVTLDEVSKNNDVWSARVRVRYEAPTTALESHRGWILENKAYFEDSQGNRVEAGGLEQTLRSKDEIGIQYLFDLADGPERLAFVYQTPLVVLELPVEYEFRDLRLP